jgi:hypothetical protein
VRRDHPAVGKDLAQVVEHDHAVAKASVTAACPKVGGEVGIKGDTLRGWAKQAQVDRGMRPGTSSADPGAGAGER